MEEEISFGFWLRKQRRALDLSRQALADQVGCAEVTLRRLEGGTLKPSKELANLLLEKLGIPGAERPQWISFARGISSLPGSSPPSTKKPNSNIPAQLTTFIGREKEQAEIIKLINKHRLITLTGSSGVGKTRLSLKVGEKVLENFPDGVRVVELAPILNPLLIPRTSAIAIGLLDEPQRPVIDMLSDYLGEKKMLLILDNCEHLLASSTQLADTLLKRCSALKVLATSREALGILGEAVYRVPSLVLPGSKEMLEIKEIVEYVRQYESVRLFEDRAQLVQVEFMLTLENAFSVAMICKQLDGIPLAIELAAARIITFSPEQIAARLSESFSLLTTGNRTALPRHQTLRAAIDWSYDLLSPIEQTLFRRLSVFVNGWTLEAAQAICLDANTKSETIVELLTELINKSLVIAEGGHDETRYHLMETMCQYGNEKLIESGESDALHDKHLKYFLNLAETAEPHLQRVEQIEWLKRLDAELENLRAALASAMEKPTAEPALRLAGALGYFWQMRSYWLEGAKWLDQALGRAWNENSKAEKSARAKVLYRRAGIADELDEVDIIKFSAESALTLCKEVEDPWGIAFSRALVASYHVRLRMPKVSRNSLEQSLNEFQKLDDAWGETYVRSWMEPVLVETGTPQEYLENIESALARARVCGDRHRIAYSLVGIAVKFLYDSKWNEAVRVLREAEQLFTEISSSYGINQVRRFRAQIFLGYGNLEKAKSEAKLYIDYCNHVGEKSTHAMTLFLLALIAEAENDLQNAVIYGKKGLELETEIGIPARIAYGLILIGLLQYRQGNIEGALQSVSDSLEFLRRSDTEISLTAFTFCYLGGIFVEETAQVAVQILAHSESLSKSFPVPRDPIFDTPYFRRFLSVAGGKLSEAEFTSAWDAGLIMTADEAMGLARKTVDRLQNRTIY